MTVFTPRRCSHWLLSIRLRLVIGHICAPMLGCFKSSVNPIVISILSRIVGNDDRGSLFCTFGIIDISHFLGVLLFNSVYERIPHLTFGGSVFLLCAAIKLIPFCVFRCVQVPPIEERQELGEELKLKDDGENGNKQDEKLLEENGNVEDQENENERDTSAEADVFDPDKKEG